MGPGPKILARVGPGQFSLQNPNFFPLRNKKISAGQIKKYPGQERVSPFFTAGQKYAFVG